MRSRRIAVLPVLLPLTGMLSASACQQDASQPLAVLVCLDGASPNLIEDLRSEGKLPTLERLIRSGTYGRLRSYPGREIMANSPRRGYYSPIVWATIATGKVPEKHGIRDFVLPIPGTPSVWMGTEEDPGKAELDLPEVAGKGPFTLRMRLHSYAPAGEQEIQVLWNEELLDTLNVAPEWETFSIPLPDDRLRPARNRLAFVFSLQARPSDVETSTDRRRLACELAAVSIVDARGEAVVSFDPVYDRFSLGRGFYNPNATTTEVQSVHLKAQPIWSLLGEQGHPVGVLGYWGTWPAYRVNGFLVSSRMGIAEKRRSPRLTWPPELAEQLMNLAPRAPDLERQFSELHVTECEPRLIDTKSVLKKILLQDELYFRVSRKLLPAMKRGFFTAYFRSIDVGSHVALHWRHGADLPAGCPDSIRETVDEIYIQMDRYLAGMLELLPEEATVLVVSDHGMQPLPAAGGHAPFGIFIASGSGIRQGLTVRGASVLDIAPTILYLFDAPVPLDMDGKILPYIFEPSRLASRPPRYVDRDTSRAPEQEVLTEGTDEILEELRALGYIE